MEDVLKTIKEFADRCHGTQMRKYTPERYIVHPVRVMELCRRYTDSLPVLAAALLHDVLEDTSVDEKELADFLYHHVLDDDVNETLKLVVELTDVYTKEDYPGWNREKRRQMEAERLSRVSGEAQTIKYADIIDNCQEILRHDRHFGPLFLKECRQLLLVMKKGDKNLYQLANEKLINESAGLNR